jgi:hypothetical protein
LRSFSAASAAKFEAFLMGSLINVTSDSRAFDLQAVIAFKSSWHEEDRANAACLQTETSLELSSSIKRRIPLLFVALAIICCASTYHYKNILTVLQTTS